MKIWFIYGDLKEKLYIYESNIFNDEDFVQRNESVFTFNKLEKFYDHS